MQNSELAVGISQLANMCRIFCWQVVISSLTKYSQLITTTLHSRANSVDYKNAPRLNLRLSHVPESAITWLETRSCHRILCCFSIIKQIFNSRPIKRNEILYVQFSENTTTHVGESAKELSTQVKTTRFLRVRFFGGKIWKRIIYPRSLELRFIKGTEESFLRVDSADFPKKTHTKWKSTAWLPWHCHAGFLTNRGKEKTTP